MAINWGKKDPDEVKKLMEKIKVSAHCNVTNPETMGFPYLESIRSFADFCNEVIVVDGGSTDGSIEKIKEIDKVKVIEGEKWNKDFNWGIMPRNLNIGYKACESDWAFHFDVDYIFHEDSVEKVVEEMAKCDFPAIEVKKVNFVMSNENFFKDFYPLLVYKARYPTVCYGIAKDMKGKESVTFLRPISRNYTRKDGLEEGETVKMSNIRVRRSEVPVYTYDFTFMTKEQISENRRRFHNSLEHFKGNEGMDVSGEKIFKLFIDMMKTRHEKCQREGRVKMKLEDHSKFIREKIKNLTPEQFGHSGFGMM